ncbi:hypothetical protein Fcan01_27427 [Folsomia candida]|uniref:Uncharacterized protein n=1 Tax=Folsomia candida TaxID=158441 RepID=A0A226CYS1_FOLCA|nr:hypothetical protein Fcan01_27427 [Folsomia candida]
MECDSVHAAIECQLKNKIISVPQDYVKVCEDARFKQPYVAIYLDHDFFTDYSGKKHQQYPPIRSGLKTGDPCVTNLRALRYNPGRTMSFKLDHRTGEWKELPQNRKLWLTQNFLSCILKD